MIAAPVRECSDPGVGGLLAVGVGQRATRVSDRDKLGVGGVGVVVLGGSLGGDVLPFSVDPQRSRVVLVGGEAGVPLADGCRVGRRPGCVQECDFGLVLLLIFGD